MQGLCLWLLVASHDSVDLVFLPFLLHQAPPPRTEHPSCEELTRMVVELLDHSFPLNFDSMKLSVEIVECPSSQNSKDWGHDVPPDHG